MMEDYYTILLSHPDSTMKEIKEKYQKLCLQLHPDKNGANKSATEFIKVHKAYKVLSDINLRQEYDSKWQQNKIAQQWPIQDEVDFSEFDEIDNEILPQTTNDETHHYVNFERKNESETCNKSESETSNQNESETFNESETIDDTLASNYNHNASGFNRTYCYPCRCGGVYSLSQTDVGFHVEYVQCDTCSLCIQVLYTDSDGDDMAMFPNE